MLEKNVCDLNLSLKEKLKLPWVWKSGLNEIGMQDSKASFQFGV